MAPESCCGVLMTALPSALVAAGRKPSDVVSMLPAMRLWPNANTRHTGATESASHPGRSKASRSTSWLWRIEQTPSTHPQHAAYSPNSAFSGVTGSVRT